MPKPGGSAPGSAPDFFRDAGVVAYPCDHFKRMRARGPVQRKSYHDVYRVTGYDEAVAPSASTIRASASMSPSGAALACAEVRTLLARTRSITLSPGHRGAGGDDGLDHEANYIIRGLERLHVRLVPSEGGEQA